MKKWFIHVIVNTIVLMVVAGFLGTFQLSSVWAALGASLILSIINVILKPILILLTLPVTILSLGLFLIVINAFLLMMTASLMGDAFLIHGFGTAFLAAIIISILNMLIEHIIIKPMLDR